MTTTMHAMPVRDRPRHALDYLLLPATNAHDGIELWSTVRPPFEPRGWPKEMRDEVAAAVRGLRVTSRRILHATYVSPVARACDAENVLFYNIGLGAFSRSMSNGVRFERSHSQPPPPPQASPKRPKHYLRYDVGDRDAGFRHWRIGVNAATWEDVELPALTGSTKVAAIWLAIGRAADTVRTERLALKPFGVRIELDVPSGAVGSTVAPFLKPLLDGLFSAFHRHDGTDIMEISRRVAAHTGADVSEVATLLESDKVAALGERKLVRRFLSGIQWNPNDDDGVAVELMVRTKKSARWSMSGALFRVEPTAGEKL